MARLRLTHIGICVSDWRRSLRFYQEGLGFHPAGELLVKGGPAAALLRLADVSLRALYLERDGVRIELLHYDSPGHEGDGSPRAMNRLGLTHLSLRVDDLDAMLGPLEACGGRILRDTRIEPQPGTKVIFATDPDGTLVELVQQPGG